MGRSVLWNLESNGTSLEPNKVADTESNGAISRCLNLQDTWWSRMVLLSCAATAAAAAFVWRATKRASSTQPVEYVALAAVQGTLSQTKSVASCSL